MQLIAVKYEGKKPYRDRTPLRNEWEPGDAKRVPERDAKTLLRFAEFSRADEAELTEQPGDAEAVIAAQQQREHDGGGRYNDAQPATATPTFFGHVRLRQGVIPLLECLEQRYQDRP